MNNHKEQTFKLIFKGVESIDSYTIRELALDCIEFEFKDGTTLPIYDIFRTDDVQFKEVK